MYLQRLCHSGRRKNLCRCWRSTSLHNFHDQENLKISSRTFLYWGPWGQLGLVDPIWISKMSCFEIIYSYQIQKSSLLWIISPPGFLFLHILKYTFRQPRISCFLSFLFDDKVMLKTPNEIMTKAKEEELHFNNNLFWYAQGFKGQLKTT